MKKCTVCKETKTLEEFHRSSRHKNGVYPQCKDCANAKKAEYRERRTELQRQKHIETIKQWRKDNPDKMRAQYRRQNLRKFGLTVQEYDSMFQRQGGRCYLCRNKPKSGRRLAIDHDHNCCPDKSSCGSCVRGLLCSNCNTALGLLRDDVDLLKKMIKYVEENRV